ncbi:MAG: hypothetical protein L3K13_08155 [Thermoplasmata archaeon]|nr:hypothetical protein [Thermoplasmata archaeon]
MPPAPWLASSDVIAGPDYREALLAAYVRAYPELRQETIPSSARLALLGGSESLPPALRVELEQTWSYPELFGSRHGRPWQISPMFAGPAFDPTFEHMPVLSLRAPYRTAPPGREREHRMPWLVFGKMPQRPTSYPDWTNVSETLLMAARARRRRLPSTLRSPGGSHLTVGASETAVEAELNSASWSRAYGEWEGLTGSTDWRGRPLSPILVGNPPWVTLYLGVRPDLSPEEFVRLPESLDRQIALLEAAVGAPVARKLPIEVESVELRDGYIHPLPEPLFRCPQCGRMTRTERGVNAAQLPVNLLTRCCREPLFASEPAH